MDLTALHSYLRTKRETTGLIIVIEKLQEAVFKQNFNLDNALSKDVPLEEKDVIEKLIRDSGINIENRQDVQTFLTKLQKEVSSLPTIHIILAISPKEEMIEAIHNWFYQNYKKTVLLDISVDETVIGGGVISFDGKANDYSLRNTISQMQSSG
ncbi:MAG TPA: F0F1 ATP synthase subunit delta [Candidatus Saccharimonadales bacterium]|nr:F0F1 ATP synthase subunit delta [Candidatus Saccharimonadales bacterium]